MSVEYLNDGKIAMYQGKRFVRDDATGYYLCADGHIRLHRYVYECEVGAIPDGYHVHHIDCDKSNNSPENLTAIPDVEHRRLHGELLTDDQRDARRKNLEVNARPKASEWHGSVDGREWHKRHYEDMKDMLHQKVPMVCEYCGKEFEAVNNGNNRFCSAACGSAARRKSGIDNESRICAVCGKEFSVNRYAKTQCCSRSCANVLSWRRRKHESKS